ncbi:LamG-like jellyroll fold domain-containing protein [Vreelandella neptunia]|uniref:LamG-like jellyroll fold domain-containing protein n=1 Tax=Vreelandella neptunia TaxID=115551 RepID=UPI003159AA72
MSIEAMLMAAGAKNNIVEPAAIDFDGTNDYLSRSVDLVGNADGKTFTFSCWVWADNVSSSKTILANSVSGQERFYLYLNSGKPTVYARNSSGTVVINAYATTAISEKTWAHIAVSINLSDISQRAFFVSDVGVTVTWSTYSNDAIDFTADYYETGSVLSGLNKIKGRLAHVYLDHTYRDLSIEANRRLFITEDGKPTKGQADLSPILYLPLDDFEAPGVNLGTGGDFALNGVVAQSQRGPNQWNCVASEFDGSADHLNRSSISGVLDSKSVIIAFNINKNTTAECDIFGITDSGNNISFQVRFRSTGSQNLEVIAYSASGSTILSMSYGNWLKTNKQHSVVVTFDLTSISRRHLVIDGKEVTASASWSTYTNDVIDLTKTIYPIGCFYFNGSPNNMFVPGDLGELYFDTTYIDLATNNPFWDDDLGKPKPVLQVLEETGNTPLIAMPIRADDAGRNYGTGGDFTVNSGPFIGARGASEFWARSVEFNGTSGHLERNAALGSDSRFFTLALAVRPDTADAGTIFCTDSGNVIKLQSNSSVFGLTLGTSAGTSIFLESSFGSHAAGSGAWNTLLICVNMDSSGAEAAYVDGAAVAFSPTTFSAGNNIGYSYSTGFEIGAQTGVNLFNGAVGFLWLSNEFIDFTQEANRMKFFDAFGYPVDVGEDGSKPTGNQPLIYMNNDFHLGVNQGSGGDFTSVNSPAPGPDVKG